ncbi:hypothetical protein JCM6882_002669 [Rhodosporidiobolus microsporus]
MRYRTLAPLLALAAAVVASPIDRAGEEGVLLARGQYGTEEEGDHFGAVLALQLFGRGALNATAAADGTCSAECGVWLNAVEPCPRTNETVALACACEPDNLSALQACATCLGSGAETQAGAFAFICPSTTSSGADNLVAESPPTSAAPPASTAPPSVTFLAASTAPSSASASNSSRASAVLSEACTLLAAAAVASLLAVVTL